MKKTRVNPKETNDDTTQKIANEFGCKIETIKVLLAENKTTDVKAYLRLLQKDEEFKNNQLLKLLFFDPAFAAEYVKKNKIDGSEYDSITFAEINTLMKKKLATEK